VVVVDQFAHLEALFMSVVVATLVYMAEAEGAGARVNHNLQAMH